MDTATATVVVAAIGASVSIATLIAQVMLHKKTTELERNVNSKMGMLLNSTYDAGVAGRPQQEISKPREVENGKAKG